MAFFRDKWQIWDGKRKACFSPSQIVTFLPVQKSFAPAGPKCDDFRKGCDKKRHKLKKIFSCARASHSSQKCDKCDESHFLSPKKVTNVTSLTQIWDGKLGRNLGKTDPNFFELPLSCLFFWAVGHLSHHSLAMTHFLKYRPLNYCKLFESPNQKHVAPTGFDWSRCWQADVIRKWDCGGV